MEPGLGYVAPMSTLLRSLALCVSLSGLLLACGDDGGSGAAGGGGASSTNGGGGAGGEATGGGGTGGAGGAGTGAGGAGGAGVGGAGGMEGTGGGAQMAMLVGEWKPTLMADSGNPPEPVPPGSPYFVFEADGDFVMGCGTQPAATWTWDDTAPDPALAVIHVTFDGGTLVDWYVTELDGGKLTFVEGGDFFYFDRDACP